MAATPVRDVRRPARARLRVVLASADARRRRAVRDALDDDPGIVVAAGAREAHEALELARWYRPDLVLVDADLPPAGAPIGQLSALAPGGVVVLSHDPRDVAGGVRALRAGARGVLSLPCDGPVLAAALRAVASGEAAISPLLAMAVLEEVRPVLDPRGLRPVRSALTAREWEVLDMLAGGATTAQVAAELHITHHTVYGHVKQILRKLEVSTRRDAVAAVSSMRLRLRA